MKIKKIKIPYYKWRVVSIIIEKHSEKDDVIKLMKNYRIGQEGIDEVSGLLDNEAIGGAMCLYNNNKLLCVIIVYPHKDSVSLVSTLCYEGRHAADRVIETVGLEGVEAAAYLNEYITTELIKDYIHYEVNKP